MVKSEKELLVSACQIFVKAFTRKKSDPINNFHIQDIAKSAKYYNQRKKPVRIKRKIHKRPKNTKNRTNWSDWEGDSTEPILGRGY